VVLCSDRNYQRLRACMYLVPTFTLVMGNDFIVVELQKTGWAIIDF